jgi:hypothetical protein
MMMLSFCLQIFCELFWLRCENESVYRWLSARRYKLDIIEMNLLAMKLIIEIADLVSYENCLTAMRNRVGFIEDGKVRMALCTLHLIECNPHVKKLVFKDDAYREGVSYRILCVLVLYLCQHCPEVSGVTMNCSSLQTLRLVMDSFPKLTTITFSYRRDVVLPLIDPITSYPNILEISLQSDDKNVEFLPLIKACPNLRTLNCYGPWILYVQHELFMGCRYLTRLSLCEYGNGYYYRDTRISPLLSALAEHALQLEEFTVRFKYLAISVQKGSLEREDMTRIIKRLRSLDMKICITNDDNDPESSLCTLFSTPGVDLRYLSIRTGYESLDVIALMLQGCRNIEKLELVGKMSISLVMMKISASCHQLVDLTLSYSTEVNGEAIKALLQSCHQLKSLYITCELIDVQAYESLAMYGGNLTRLILQFIHDDTLLEPATLSIGASSPLYDPSFKQQRKCDMACLSCDLCDLDVMSLAKFLSCFERIGDLSIRLTSSQIQVSFGNESGDDLEYDNYHARKVSIRSPTSPSDPESEEVLHELMSILKRY